MSRTAPIRFATIMRLTLTSGSLVWLSGLMLLTLSLPTRADEGLWLFSSLPQRELKRRYSFVLEDALRERLQKATVCVTSRGSGAFVSADGLVLTSWHVIMDLLDPVALSGRDLTGRGFLASTRGEELRLPGLELSVTESSEDISERVREAVKPAMGMAEAHQARRAAVRSLEEESRRKTGLESKVVGLYHGGQYRLERYQKYTDIRLVFVPEQIASAFFDVAFLRAYQDGKPARVKHFLPWSSTPPRSGDLTLVSGFPGVSYRFLAPSDLESHFGQTTFLPLKYALRYSVVLSGYAEKGPVQAMEANAELRLVASSLQRGLNRMANQEKALAGIRVREAAQRARLFASKDQASQDRYRKAMALLDSAVQHGEGMWHAYFLLEHRSAAFNSKLFRFARDLVRLEDEETRQGIERRLLVATRITAELEIAKLADSLDLFATYAGKDKELLARILAGKTPAERARALVTGSRLGDLAVRKALFEGGAKAVARSQDPMLVLARLVEPRALDLRRQFNEEVIEPQTQAYTLLTEVSGRSPGGADYPDASDSLRLSFGKVQGFEREDGPRMATGLLTATEFFRALDADAEQLLQGSWKKAASLLAPGTPLLFTSSVDSVGGSSGSPVLDRQGHLLGVLASAVGDAPDLEYAEGASGSGGVPTQGIGEVLDKVYQAKALLGELGVRPATTNASSPSQPAEAGKAKQGSKSADKAGSSFDNKIYTSKNVFHLPIKIDEHLMPNLKEVYLYVKEGSGPWTRKETAKPTQPHFVFHAPHDGEYGFSVVTLDKQGQLMPKDVTKEPPAMIVVVDTSRAEARAETPDAAVPTGSKDIPNKSKSSPGAGPSNDRK